MSAGNRKFEGRTEKFGKNYVPVACKYVTRKILPKCFIRDHDFVVALLPSIVFLIYLLSVISSFLSHPFVFSELNLSTVLPCLNLFYAMYMNAIKFLKTVLLKELLYTTIFTYFKYTIQ